MMNLPRFLTPAIAAIPLVVMGAVISADVHAQPQRQVVSGDRWNFSLPSDWVTTNYPQPGIGQVTLEAQYTSPDGGMFVNMITEPFPGDAETYLQLNLENMQTFGFTVHAQDAAQIGQLDGIQVESSVPNDPPMRVLQRMTLADGTGYVLTCRTLESTFASYRDRCVTILDSFTVRP